MAFANVEKSHADVNNDVACDCYCCYYSKKGDHRARECRCKRQAIGREGLALYMPSPEEALEMAVKVALPHAQK